MTKSLKPICAALLAGGCFGTGVLSAEPVDVTYEQSTLIPKRETGVLEFLEQHPEYDGRDVVIAVFDTGVDPAAAGLQTTSTGERKIVDLIDASGSGDVDTSTVIEKTKEGTLEGLTGRTLTLPEKIKNPSGKFHIGIKRGTELFHRDVLARIKRLRGEDWDRKQNNILTKRLRDQSAALEAGERKAFEKADGDRDLKEQDQVAREELLESLEKDWKKNDQGPVYDCVLWSDGKQFHVVIDTDEDGDLADEKVLLPFGVDGHFASFGDEEASHFSVQVYEEGNLLSIVTVSGSHGSHVAAIAAAHFPEQPHRNGIAPGARILSIKIGDIRMGGSSGGASEMRAVATCAQYGVDIMNASWGGSSVFQDGSDIFSRLYNLLVERYGVTAFVSAGNNGPALSTLGKPGGEARSIIGVGAYVSPDMGRVLYNLTKESPGTAYNFTSRGPGKSGDLGVDIMGPGGATASLAFDALRQSQRYNGTSMSAPSLAGAGALLISAAKQKKIEVTPLRIRNALMNGAEFLNDVDVWAQGAGLAKLLPAWEHLESNASESAWDYLFDIKAEDNTYADGPGVYLREVLAPGKRRTQIEVTPEFMESVENREKFLLDRDIILKATQPWIEIPEYARFANGTLRFDPILDIPALAPDSSENPPLFGEIHGFLADAPDAGPLFRVPVTIIRARETDADQENRVSFVADLEAGAIHRSFYRVPENSNRLKVRLQRESGDRIPRTYLIHSVTPTAVESFGTFEGKDYVSLKGGQEEEVEIPVAPGKVTEVVLHQLWSSDGGSSVKADLQFTGVRAQHDVLRFSESDRLAPLTIASATDIEVQPEGEITRARFVLLPEKTEFLVPDKRHELPPGPRTDEVLTPVFLRQTFTFSVEKPTKVRLEAGRRFDGGHDLSGSFYAVYHESGELLFQGSRWARKEFTLPKGKTTFYRDIRTLSQAFLEREKVRPLVLSHPLEKKPALRTFESIKESIRDQPAKELSFRQGRNYQLIVQGKDIAGIKDLKPAPTSFTGQFRLKQVKDDTLLSLPVEFRIGDDFGAVANQKKKPASRDEKKEVAEKLAADLFDRKLEFVRATRFSKKESEQSQRDETLGELLEEKPKDADLFVESALILAGQAGWLSAWHRKAAEGEKEQDKDSAKKKDKGKDGREPAAAPGAEPAKDNQLAKNVFQKLNLARKFTKPREVAEFFGSRRDVSDGALDEKKADAQKLKTMENRRTRLAETALLRADVHLHLEQMEDSRKSLREARRWQESLSDSHNKQEIALLKAEKFFGLALKKTDAALKKVPFDSELQDSRIALLEELGWAEFAERARLMRSLRKASGVPLGY